VNTPPLPDPADAPAPPAAPAVPGAEPPPATTAASADAAIPDGWQSLPPAARTVSTIAATLVAIPVVIGPTITLSVLQGSGLGGRATIFAVLLALVAIACVLFARARWRRTRWRLDERGLQVRRGLVWQSEVLVPRSRVQHLDIERGPIERRFGLATLVVHTAGTRLNALRQAGFLDADAVALRDALLPESGHVDDEL
jgi:uncharacterized protein